ncbi:MFS transporter [Streptomyces daqingensis]|uniref:MFS transporter n=1 Tax=Streptomyces daqingensis TaxID=1472640 RepID=A0ABQ2MYF9_9ACTN|nr:MFS transporter [Streptomyces daqingensis]GGO58302.1 MFS transporter [Streptomyces daqingensis]
MGRLARRLCAYAFFEDLILLYPVYALLFAEHGLSTGEISSLFIIWSCVTFVLEVPSGMWADLFSRRLLVVLAPLLTGAGFALWTWLPSYPAFACGFLLWGAGGSLSSGSLQALVYEELARHGATASYARIMGRSQAMGTTAMMAATALAGPVLGAGGYEAVGAASVVVCLIGAAVGLTLPEPRRGSARGARPDDGERNAGGTPERGFGAVLRAGAAELRGSRAALRAVLLSSAVTGALMIDEYVPLLVGSMDVAASTVPTLMLLVSAGVAVGGWCAGRGTPRLLGPALGVAALALAAGSVSGPAGTPLLALAFGIFQWAMVTCDALLQDRVTDRARATVASVAGFGAEVFSVLLCAAYGLGSARWGHSTLFVLAAVPYLLIALALLRHGRRPPAPGGAPDEGEDENEDEGEDEGQRGARR